MSTTGPAPMAFMRLKAPACLTCKTGVIPAGVICPTCSKPSTTSLSPDVRPISDIDKWLRMTLEPMMVDVLMGKDNRVDLAVELSRLAAYVRGRDGAKKGGVPTLRVMNVPVPDVEPQAVKPRRQKSAAGTAQTGAKKS